MILFFIAVFLAVAGLIWFWVGPVRKSAGSLQEEGSGKTEAYVLILLLGAVLITAIYMIMRVLQ